ncbi:hypothetical protein [Streptomyces sp. SAI-090]|jgi:hypothetical protein|uniref:hypothetical protein n=1 Tax=Streptomyces sp. SAI-090 TaxID=2940545 RepID=UPI0024746ED9|nr:hypothetical protein [Streptomyces sp. SAI-090]MDH6522239.1 hypothetical protein [Streptomyces sp. SAI-090]
MTGHIDAYTPSTIADAARIASDIKDDQSGFLSGISTFNIIATVLVIGVMVLLMAELIWRERRQRGQGESVTPPDEPDPHEGEISP